MTERLFEIKNLRDLNTKHFQNDDGTITANMSLVPIHYKENGEFQDVDLNIISEKNFEFEYSAKKNNFKAYFNDVTDINNYTLAGFEIINSEGKSRWINYKLFNAAPTSSVCNSSTFKYLEVFKDIDLEYVLDSTRLKENIIIKAPQTNYKFSFTLKLDEFIEMQELDGEFKFIDKETQEELWKIAKPYAIDNKGKRTEKVKYTVSSTEYKDITYKSIEVLLDDEEFIKNAEFPIMIDPTTQITNTALAKTAFSWTWDAENKYYDDSAYSYNPIFSSYERFTTNMYKGEKEIRKYDKGAGEYYTVKYRSENCTCCAIKFDNAQFLGKAIKSATFDMQVRGANGEYNGSLYMRSISSPWDSSTVKYSTRPAGDIVYSASGISLYAENYSKTVSVNATGAVSQWANGKNNGLMFEVQSQGFCYSISLDLEIYNFNYTYILQPSVPAAIALNPITKIDEKKPVTITWGSSTNSTSFVLEVQQNGGAWTQVYTGTALSYDYITLATDNTLAFRVKARNTEGGSNVDSGCVTSSSILVEHGKTYVKVNGAYVKGKVYIKQNGAYTQVQIQYKNGGGYQKL